VQKPLNWHVNTAKRDTWRTVGLDAIFTEWKHPY
jgi:hypothetical protein